VPSAANNESACDAETLNFTPVNVLTLNPDEILPVNPAIADPGVKESLLKIPNKDCATYNFKIV
jgi:hypothetical protein